MSKPKRFKTAKGRGWVGLWNNNTGPLGWGMPEYLHGSDGSWVSKPCKTSGRCSTPEDRLVLCEIIVRPVVDSRGRHIYRKDIDSRAIRAARAKAIKDAIERGT